MGIPDSLMATGMWLSASSTQNLLCSLILCALCPWLLCALASLAHIVVPYRGLPSKTGDALPMHQKCQGIYIRPGYALAHDLPSQNQPCLESGQILGCSLHFWVSLRIRMKLPSGGLCLKSLPYLASALLSYFSHSWLVTTGNNSQMNGLHMNSFHLMVCIEGT